MKHRILVLISLFFSHNLISADLINPDLFFKLQRRNEVYVFQLQLSAGMQKLSIKSQKDQQRRDAWIKAQAAKICQPK